MANIREPHGDEPLNAFGRRRLPSGPGAFWWDDPASPQGGYVIQPDTGEVLFDGPDYRRADLVDDVGDGQPFGAWVDLDKLCRASIAERAALGWPLAPEEIERRRLLDEAQALGAAHPAYHPETCDLCRSMQWACGKCRWLHDHPDYVPERDSALAGQMPPDWARRIACQVCYARGTVWDKQVGDWRPCPCCNAPAPPYPGIIPGGLADRARARGPRYPDPRDFTQPAKPKAKPRPTYLRLVYKDGEEIP